MRGKDEAGQWFKEDRVHGRLKGFLVSLVCKRFVCPILEWEKIFYFKMEEI